jgi:hypothetical protein
MNEKELTNLRPAKRAMGGTDFSTWRRTFGPESHAGKSVRAGCGQCETFSERFSWTEVHSPCQTFDKNRKRGQMLETGWWDQAPPLRVMERLTIVLAKRLPVVRQVVKISQMALSASALETRAATKTMTYGTLGTFGKPRIFLQTSRFGPANALPTASHGFS